MSEDITVYRTDQGGLSEIDPSETASQLQGCRRSFLGVAIMETIMNYQFNIELASKYGVDEAILLHNIIFWLRKNKSNGSNFNDGRTWTYNSANAFTELFPFWNARKIARILKSLEDQEIIVSGNYNAMKYDRTKWYALKDETLLDLPLDKSANGCTDFVQPIPDSKPDSKQDSNTDKEVASLQSGKEHVESRDKKPKPEDKKAATVPLDPSLTDVFDEWLAYKREKRQGYKTIGLNALIKKLNKYPVEVVRKAVADSISNNWSGLFPERVSGAEPVDDREEVYRLLMKNKESVRHR